MKPPVYNSAWSPLVQRLYLHDMQELWDPHLSPHVYTCYNDELSRYLRIAGARKLRILDVGCAQGTLALKLAEAGHSVVAIDIRPEFLEYAKTRYEHGEVTFVEGNALDLGLDGKFDLVFANQILEHVVLPVPLLSRLRGMLVPGGRLVATTPSAEYFKNRLPTFTELGDYRQHLHRQFFPDGDGHFFAYTSRELSIIAGQAGLEHVIVRRYASPWITGHTGFRVLHGRVARPVLRCLDRLLLGIPGLRRACAYQLMLCGRAPA